MELAWWWCEGIPETVNSGRRAAWRQRRAGMNEAPGKEVAVASTVLLVEDEPKLRDLVRSYLERAGHAVLSTGSGAEAISLARSASPDLVILDLGLPDVPGEAVTRERRGRPDPRA